MNDHIWNELRSSSAKAEQFRIIRRLMTPESARDIEAGIDLTQDQPLIMTAVACATADNLPSLPQFAGIQLKFERLPEDGSNQTHFIIRLTEPANESMFSLLARDISELAGTESQDRRALDIMCHRLIQWQEMLRKDTEKLSAESQRGLLGELLFMRNILALKEHPGAIMYWKGPRGFPHDFGSEKLGIEVKTAISSGPLSVKINGEHQLDSQADQSLILYVIQLLRAAESGITLPGIVEEIRLLLGNGNAYRDFLEHNLTEVGYHDEDAHIYGDNYHISSVHIFDVAGDFPRITAASLPSAIGGISYNLSLANAEKWHCSERQLMIKIKESIENGQ